MKLLRTITNKDFGEQEIEKENLYLRNAARAVLLNDKNEVAVLYVENGDYHKIPGGGIEENESIEEALLRELIEETGVKDCEILKEVGEILEYRDDIEQHSFCYLARVKGSISKPEFTKEELIDGFNAPIWIPINKAIELFKGDGATFLRAKFMSLRDRTFLEEAARILKS